MRLRSITLPIAVAGLVATLVAVPSPTAAQQPIPQSSAQPGDNGNGYEVLASGPVHEAYAATAEFPVAGPVVTKQPPEPVEEMPPDQRPEGDNVQWIPGYWGWDEERSDFIWVSGFWRVPPPGRVWVPGSWRQVQGGWQWVQGFWQEMAPDQPNAPQADIEYLPPPPEPLQAAAVPAPDQSHFFVPGTWMWRETRYVWRPGFWQVFRPGWMWVPAHYKWTPIGYVFVEGYWDYELVRRGVLFAPVAFTQVAVLRPAFVYTPTYVVSYQSMFTSLFVRRGWGSYYFGDYFQPQYTRRGFLPWAAPALVNLNLNIGRRAAYDPMWSYYQTAHRADPQWSRSVVDVYTGRYRGDYPLPPRTLNQQTTVLNNITNNVTNITNNVNRTTVINNVTMVAPISKIQSVAPANTRIELTRVNKDDRVREQRFAKEYREVASQRQRLEAKLAAQAPAPKQPPMPGQQTPMRAIEKPQQVKLAVPKQAVARAQTPTAPDRTPPPPPKQIQESRPGRPMQPTPMNPMQPTPKNPKQPKGPPVQPMQPTPPKGQEPKQPKQPMPPKGQEPKQPMPPKGQQPTPPKGQEPKQPTPPPAPKEPKGPPMQPGQPPINPMRPTPPPGQIQPKRPQEPKAPPATQPGRPPTPIPMPTPQPQPQQPKGQQPKAPQPQPQQPKGQQPKPPVTPATPQPRQPMNPIPHPPTPVRPGQPAPKGQPPAIPVPKGAPVRPTPPQPPKGGQPMQPTPAQPGPPPRPAGNPLPPPPKAPMNPAPPQPPGKASPKPPDKGKGREKDKDDKKGRQ